MKAEEMFKELGYKKTIDDGIKWITYTLYNGNGDAIFIIEFYKLQQDITIWSPRKDYKILGTKEIKAITKQIEELGWE